MQKPFLPVISNEKLALVLSSGNNSALFQLLVEPLHEELYRRQTFEFLDSLTDGQHLLLAYDYVLQQVMQGGFIQLLANGYVGLLPEMPRLLQIVGANDMALVIDEVLKLYVEHHAFFTGELSTREFAGLYNKLPAFSKLDIQFEQLNNQTIAVICNYARSHLQQFIISE